MFDLVIRNGLIVDGQKRPRYAADIGISGDRITAIERLEQAEARLTIDAKGRVVVPGFIDVHTHSDAILLAQPHLVSKTTQGFTTEFLMLDGISYAPVSRQTVHAWIQYLRALDGLRFEQYTGWESIADYMSLLDGKTAQNVAAFAPYANIRSLALGFGERHANDYQLVDLQNLVRQSMDDGACGLSTGLDYVDECFATTDELIYASQGMRAEKGVYVTHVRYARGTLEGVKEAVEIGRRAGAPVHISHLKGATEQEVEALIDYIDLVAVNEVDFSFDVYPYMGSSTMLQYLLPLEIWGDGVLAAYGKLTDETMRARFQRRLDTMDLTEITIAWTPGRHNRHLCGMTLEQYVRRTKRRAADALCDLLIEEAMAVLLVFHRVEAGLEAEFVAHPCYMMGSDGIFFASGKIHPRQYGSATRLLSHHMRRKRLFSLEDAVYKLSGFAAARFKLKSRGAIRKGYFADLVIFDPETVHDHATFDNPHQLSTGIDHVIVNGIPILQAGKPVNGATPGRYLRFGVE
ncbi:D-aminoacylase [Caldilinea sp.]|uniref:N-acyl-D-amino-acid deacylase family protein n=1 Tax=Caldilinea sp. TaxID=2293560 RepID=UPI002D13DC9F|nr:D-aminoacylase [Anaerolineales bacterium]HQY91919.1 D-aminoacylase [Caldilinea sp.]